MKKALLFCICSFFLLGSLQAQDKDITNEDIWKFYKFYPKYVSGFNFLKDGKHYSKTERTPSGMSILEYDLVTGEKTREIFNGSALSDFDPNLSASFSGYSFNEDETRLLIRTEQEAIYRRSYKAFFYIYDIEKKSLMPLSKNGKQSYATFNPQNDKIAFFRDNNLFYKDLKNGKEVQVTNDGQFNHIINGQADWVYEEEFSVTKLFQWSPDGSKLVFLRFDEKDVKEFTMTLHTGKLYPEYSTFKYPKVGEKNSVVTAHIYDLKSEKTMPIQTDVKAEYFPRLYWTKDNNKICLYQMNRHQNHLQVLLADANTGKTTTLLEEKNKYYIDINDNLTFLEDGKHFVWTSEKDGYNHIYLYDMNGKEVKQLTKGDYDVTKFYGVDEKNKVVYYQSSEASPLERHIYSAKLTGRAKCKKLSPKSGHNDAQFSSTFDYYILTHSTSNSPYDFTVYNAKGKEVRVLEDNKAFKEEMKTYNLSNVEFFDFKTSEEVSLNGYMIKPKNFDKAKKYPVLMYVYGGPGSQTAENTWGGPNYFWFQMLANKGYIIVSVDNRGTGARGEEFKKITYLELGKYETIDQIETAKYLGNLDYVDAERIGIWGWSFGGYLSSSCLLKGNDVFKMAIAVAPVTNWKWYDNIYTERYMRTETENPEGYKNNSPVNFANQLKGKYLIIHGNADDNVHFQHTAEMANALIRANKQFDTYFYPIRNHGIYGGGARLHLYNKMTDFILENL